MKYIGGKRTRPPAPYSCLVVFVSTETETLYSNGRGSQRKRGWSNVEETVASYFESNVNRDGDMHRIHSWAFCNRRLFMCFREEEGRILTGNCENSPFELSPERSFGEGNNNLESRCHMT